MAELVSNQWGTRSFQTREDAERWMRPQAEPGKPWYLWRLADGTFDFSASPEPDYCRWYPDHAEMVATINRKDVLPCQLCPAEIEISAEDPDASLCDLNEHLDTHNLSAAEHFEQFLAVQLAARPSAASCEDRVS